MEWRRLSRTQAFPMALAPVAGRNEAKPLASSEQKIRDMLPSSAASPPWRVRAKLLLRKVLLTDLHLMLQLDCQGNFQPRKRNILLHKRMRLSPGRAIRCSARLEFSACPTKVSTFLEKNSSFIEVCKIIHFYYVESVTCLGT